MIFEKYKNTFFIACSQILKTFFLGTAFILLARQLGPSDFGNFVSVSALYCLVSPFVDMGLYHVNIQYYSQGHDIDSLFGASLQTVIILGLIFFPLAMAVSSLIFDISFVSLFLLGTQILLIEKIFPIANSLLVCVSKYNSFSVIEILQGFLRLLAVFILYLTDGGVVLWSVFYLAQGLILTSGLSIWLFKKFKIKKCDLHHIISRTNVGKNYLSASLLEIGLQEFDRILVNKISGPVIAGFYGAVMRINNFAMVPINAFFVTVYKQYFDQGRKKEYFALRHAIDTIKKSMLASVIIGLGIVVSIPIIIYLLGPEYAPIKNVLIISAFIPVSYSATQPLLDSLSGTGNQKSRILIMGFIVSLNLVFLTTLLPRYNILGAVISIMLSRLFILPFYYIFIRKHSSEWTAANSSE